ncbi:hypothetical protein B4903_22015 [Yersinia frederiksenii]|nr:hypothetical protein B4903_22015 [Yersinia frederiksenii]
MELKNKKETYEALTEMLLNGHSIALKNILATVLNSAFDAVLEEYENSGVCCFISNSGRIENESPLGNRLMWSHYANGLRGFVLELKKDKIFDFKECNVTGPYIVNYTNNYPVIDLVDLAMQHFVNKDQEKTNKYISLMIESKNKDWEYENEVRYICSNGNALLKYNPKAIESLHIGEKMPKTRKGKYNFPLLEM